MRWVITMVLLLLFIMFLSARDQPCPSKEIVLGVTTSLDFTEGRESFLAAELAAEKINATGGIRLGDERLPIRIESVDLKGANLEVPVSEALERLERFLVEKKPHGIIVGPYRSEVMLSAMDIIAQHKIPLLCNIAMSQIMESKVLNSPKYKYVFRVGCDTRYLVEYMINTMRFLRETCGFDRVYIMIQDTAWSKTTASQVVKLYFDRSDWQVTGMDVYTRKAVDFTEGLMRAKYKNAQIIMTLFDMPESAELVKQWKRLKADGLLFGFISPLLGPDAWRTFDGKITGALMIGFEIGNIPSKQWDASMVFYHAYKKKYGKEIQAGHGPAPAYESVYILAQAIEKAGALDSDKIVAALESTDRNGAMGRIRFHRGHQVIFGNDPTETALACVAQWQSDGQRKIIYPLSIADGELEIPFHAP